MRSVAVFCLCIFLCSCASHHDEGGDVTAHANLIKLSSDSIQLSIKSVGKGPACISAADLSPSYGRIRIFGKGGKEIFRSNSANRELQTFKGMDVADGVLVSSTSKNKKILIPLSAFPIENEESVRGYLEFSYSSCLSLFGNRSSVRSKRVSF